LPIELGLGLPAGTFFGDQVLINETFFQENESFSIFGTVDFDVTDKFSITVGGNYTDDNKDVSVSTVNNDLFSDLDLLGPTGAALLTGGLTPAILPGSPGIPAAAVPIVNGAFAAQVAPLVAAGILPNGDFTAANVALLQSIPDNPALPGGGAAAFAAFQAGTAAAIIGGADLTDPAQNALIGLTAFQFQPQFLNFPNSVEDGRTRDEDFSWSVRGNYEINDNFNVYASAATGFKASSFNLTRDSRPFVSDGAALAAAGLLPNNFSLPDPNNVAFPTGRNFGTRFALPEEITTFEVGLKSRFERGALNIALFDQEVENFQSTIFQGTGFVLSNAGSQSSQGVEFGFGRWCC